VQVDRGVSLASRACRAGVATLERYAVIGTHPRRHVDARLRMGREHEARARRSHAEATFDGKGKKKRTRLRRHSVRRAEIATLFTP